MRVTELRLRAGAKNPWISRPHDRLARHGRGPAEQGRPRSATQRRTGCGSTRSQGARAARSATSSGAGRAHVPSRRGSVGVLSRGRRGRRTPLVRDGRGPKRGERTSRDDEPPALLFPLNPSRTSDQIDSRSAFAAACRRSLTSASSRAARSMRSCWTSERSCWLLARSCWLSARSRSAVSWRSISATVRVRSASCPATLAMSSLAVISAGF